MTATMNERASRSLLAAKAYTINVIVVIDPARSK